MPDLLALPLRGAALVIRSARWVVGQTVELLRRGDDGQATPAPPPAPPAPPAARAKPAPKPRPKPRAKAQPKPKRPVRREPTRGEVAGLRERQREAEQNAGGPGPGATIEVAEPWKGYDAMTEDAILERLIGAEPALRAIVRLYEAQNGGRRQILIATEEVTAQP